MMKPDPTNRCIHSLLLIISCLFVNTATYADPPQPVQAIVSPSKPHCDILDVESPLYKNLRKAAQYIRRGDIETVERVVRHNLPVNAYFEEEFVVEGQLYQAKVGLLDMAVMFGKHDILDMLLKEGAHPDGCGTDKLDPFYLAITNGDFQSLNTLIAASPQPDRIIGPEALQQTALHRLAGHPKGCQKEPVSREILGSMQRLLSHGANVDAADHKGETALTQSIRNCKFNPTYPLTSLLLITHGANPYLETHQGINIFHRMLADGTLSRNNDLWSLLANYVWSGGQEVLLKARQYPDLLVRLGAIQNEISAPKGFFSWLWSLKGSWGTLNSYLQEITSILSDPRVLSHNPQTIRNLVNCTDNKPCFTPLHYAGHTFLTPEALSWLEWLGTDFSESSYEGNTVLHYAIKNNQVENIHTLAPYRVEPTLRNHLGMSSFDMAMMYTPDEDRHAMFSALCNMDPDNNNPVECAAYMDLFNTACTQAMAAENVTQSAHPELENRYLSSFSMKHCLNRPDHRVTPSDKLEVLSESLSTTHERINHHDKTWVLPRHVKRYDMLDYPELKNYLIKQFPEQSDHLKDEVSLIQFMNVQELESGMGMSLYHHPDTETRAGTGTRPSKSQSAAFQRLNNRAEQSMPSDLGLHSLQSFAQLKYYLANSRAPEKKHIQTYLIQRNEPELFLYTLTMGMGLKAQPSCQLPTHQSYLCRDPMTVITESSDARHFWNLLQLYGHYDFSLPPSSKQLLDLSLHLAVHHKNAYFVEQLLSRGANPNAYIPEEHKILIREFLSADARDAFPHATCGLLADALRLEQNQDTASLSRLLLLYGASVDPVMPHGCSLLPDDQQGSPLSWIGRIKDRGLAVALNYFDPANIRYRTIRYRTTVKDAETWRSDDYHSDYQTTVNVLHSASNLHTLMMHNDAYSPLCTCTGLQSLQQPLPDGQQPEPFTPYCQQQISNLPESVQMSICSPAVFR